MTSELATLRLEPAVVTRAFEDGNITRLPQSHFLDLVVKNRSLQASVGEPARDLVTQLNRPWLPAVPEAVSRFLGRRESEDLASERVALLVCAMDGDLGCGQLTAALEVGDAEVSWSDFLWEDGNFDPRPVEHSIELTGGGGTDMRVGIDAAHALHPRPDVVVVLTDGYTPWFVTVTPARLVIGLINDAPTPPPTPAWATTVRIPTTG